MDEGNEKWLKAKDDFNDWYMQQHTKLLNALDMYKSLITSLLMDREELCSNPEIEGRLKEKRECLVKFERKYLKEYKDDDEITCEEIKSHITDLIGIRVICSYEDEIEKVKEIIENNFTIISETDKTSELEKSDAFDNSSKFGYKGFHLDIKLNDDRLKFDEYKKLEKYNVEVQIRTAIQHAWSQLDHKIKYKHNIPEELKRAINRLSALFEIADSEFMRIRKETSKQDKESEKKIKDAESNKESDDSEKLDSITFENFMRIKFFNFLNQPPQLRNMLLTLFEVDKNISIKVLVSAFDKKYEVVNNYVDYARRVGLVYSMNPYTQLRHILYAYDKEKYSSLLNSIQKINFDHYCNDNSKQ